MSKNPEEQLSLFPSTIYKYLLLISPPDVVMHRIQELKKYLVKSLRAIMHLFRKPIYPSVVLMLMNLIKN